MPQDLPLKEIAERIADAILSDRYLNKGRIIERVRPILKTWLKRTADTKDEESPVTTLKRQWDIAVIQFETRFWHDRFRDVVGEEAMKEHYQKLTKEQIEFCDDYFIRHSIHNQASPPAPPLEDTT